MAISKCFFLSYTSYYQHVSGYAIIFTSKLCLSIHPPSAFGASPNLEALALEESKSEIKYGDIAVNASSKFQGIH